MVGGNREAALTSLGAPPRGSSPLAGARLALLLLILNAAQENTIPDLKTLRIRHGKLHCSCRLTYISTNQRPLAVTLTNRLHSRRPHGWRRNHGLRPDWFRPFNRCWMHCWRFGMRLYLLYLIIWLPHPRSRHSRTLRYYKLTQLFSKYAVGGYRMQNKQPYGLELALLASLVLAGSSLPRALRTQKPLPIGLTALAAFGLWNFGMAYRNNVSVS